MGAFAESLEKQDTSRNAANREDIRLQKGARLCWELDKVIPITPGDRIRLESALC